VIPKDLMGTEEEPEKKISKGEVLTLAMKHIKALERKQDLLERRRQSLANDVEHLKGAWTELGGESIS